MRTFLGWAFVLDVATFKLYELVVFQVDDIFWMGNLLFTRKKQSVIAHGGFKKSRAT